MIPYFEKFHSKSETDYEAICYTRQTIQKNWLKNHLTVPRDCNFHTNETVCYAVSFGRNFKIKLVKDLALRYPCLLLITFYWS